MPILHDPEHEPIYFKITIGRIVHYREQSGREKPAIITHVWSNLEEGVDLVVFNDGKYDWALPTTYYQTTILRGRVDEDERWHPSTECS